LVIVIILDKEIDYLCDVANAPIKHSNADKKKDGTQDTRENADFHRYFAREDVSKQRQGEDTTKKSTDQK